MLAKENEYLPTRMVPVPPPLIQNLQHFLLWAFTEMSLFCAFGMSGFPAWHIL